jgi:hypothetical protein
MVPLAPISTCTADGSTEAGSPVTSWAWDDLSLDPGGKGYAASNTDPVYILTFSQAVTKTAKSTAVVTACTGSSSTSCANGYAKITIDPPPGCRIDVRARPIQVLEGVAFGYTPAYHLFIVMVAKDGTETFVRGGPDDDETIEVDDGPYLPRSIDYPNPPNDTGFLSRTVMTGEDACQPKYYDCFVRVGTAINKPPRIPYSATGPNSNTVVRTLLHDCGLPELTPSLINTPGWGDPPLR